MLHCGSGQKDHETWARKELIAAAKTITPSVNAEAALLLAGEGTTSAWRQELIPVYTGLERFPASLMKDRAVPCPPLRTGETTVKGTMDPTDCH